MKNSLVNIGSSSISLGDVLCITPLCCAVDTIVELLPTVPRLHTLFNGIATVSSIEEPCACNNTKDKTHLAQRILNYYNVSEVNCIPKIKLIDSELAAAKEIVNKYKNPIIFKNAPLSQNPSHRMSIHRRMPPEIERWLLDLLCDAGFTVLQFNMTPQVLDSRIIQITGLDLRIWAACYSLVNKYIGVDSGDYYLMLAAGGKAIILVNESNSLIPYNHYDWLFLDKLWKDETPRVKYIPFTEYKSVEKSLNFLN